MKTQRLMSLVVMVLFLGSMFKIPSVKAMDCFADPVYTYDWTGTVVSGVYVRDVACMDGSTVLTTLSAGAKVSVTGSTSQTPYVYTPAPTADLSASAATNVRARTVGYILLQVESHGEAWYVDPVSKYRYYMKDGPTAYEMMRTFGLGMTEADYARLAGGNTTLINSLKGRIVLRVQLHGEAYYIHPDGTIYYLADGPAAYSLMRLHSLGITNTDLAVITSSELQLIPYGDDGVVLGETDESIVMSEYQAGVLPDNFDIATLNQTWLDLLNAERVAHGQSSLKQDQGLVDTATNWAAYIGEVNSLTHTRPGGQSLLSWASELDYPASSFGENLVMVYAKDSSAGMEQIVTDAMSMFMAEESYNGAHFQNVVNPNWGSSGVGFYFETFDQNTYRVYVTFHFASLEN